MIVLDQIVLCSLCSLYRLPILSIFFLYDMPSLYSVHGPYSVRLCAGCAQDGQSFAVQAWPSHSRWSCKPGIHGIRGRGDVPTHGSREPSDAPVRSRTSMFQERFIDDVQQAGNDRIHLYVALASQRLATSETQPHTKCCTCIAKGISRIIQHHIT